MTAIREGREMPGDAVADDEQLAVEAQEKAATIANPGWAIWPVRTYKHGWQWNAIPPVELHYAYMELAGEKDSAHWGIWGVIPPGGHLLGFASVSELQEAIDEVAIRAANPPPWQLSARSGELPTPRSTTPRRPLGWRGALCRSQVPL